MIKKFLLAVTMILSASIINASEFLVVNQTELVIAISSSKPGDIIKLKNGTWNNIMINFQNNGVEGNPLILKAETAGEVIISGKSNLRIAGKYLVVDGLIFKAGSSASSAAVVEFKSSSGVESSYCRLTNTSIIDYNPTDTNTDYKWISLFGDHNRVDHCYLKGKTHIGTTLVVWLSAKPNYHLIDSNYFAYRPVFPENGAETIRVGTSDWSMYDSFTSVESNYFEECNGEIEIISNKSCGNVYRYNTFKNCQGTLTLRHGNRCTVEGNYFFCGKKTDSGGIRIIGEDHKVINNYVEDSYGTSYKAGITLMNGVPNSPLNRYFQVKRALVAFNTIVNARMSLQIGAGKDSELSLPPLDCIIANNIFYSTSSPLVTLVDNPINMKMVGNDFYGATVGISISVGNLNVDPQLKKDLDYLYRPSSTSPVINSSDPSVVVEKDIDGQSRSNVCDIGADEVLTLPIKVKPVVPSDVGPVYLRKISGINFNEKNIPEGFYLGQNYPNPFNPVTTINWRLSKGANVKLKVFDVLGREIVSIIDEYKSPGAYSYLFSSEEFKLTSGVYLCTLTADGHSETRKMNLIK